MANQFDLIGNSQLFPVGAAAKESKIQKILYFTAQEPFISGAPGFVGARQNGRTSWIGTGSINSDFVDSNGLFNQAGWRVTTASNYGRCPGDCNPYFIIDQDTVYSLSQRKGNIAGINATTLFMDWTGTLGATWTEAARYPVENRFRWSLSGDLDIQLSFSEFTKLTDNTTEIGFTFEIRRGGGNVYETMRIQLTNYTDGLYHIRSDQYRNGVEIISTTVNGAQSGKIRLTRTGTVGKTFYDIGGGWVQLGANRDLSVFMNNADVCVDFIGEMNSSAILEAIGKIKISNFTINAGTFTDYCGWYNEAASAYRSAVQAMPSECIAIGSDSGMDIYDIGNSSVWMRSVTGSTSWIAGNENLFHISGTNTQRPLDFAWTPHGKLLSAYGKMNTAPSTTQRGGLITFPFNYCLPFLQRTTGSISNYLSQVNYGPHDALEWSQGEGIPFRNSNRGFSSGSDISPTLTKNWGVHTDSVLGVDYYTPSTAYGAHDYEYWLGANEEGLRVFGKKFVYPVPTAQAFTSSTDSSILNTRHVHAKFNQSNGDFYFVTNTNLYYTAYNTYANSLTQSNPNLGASMFTPDSSVALLGTRTNTSTRQFRFCRDSHDNVYIPADEGIYKSDNLLSDHSLYIGSGGTHDILNTYDSIKIIKSSYCATSLKNYLFYGYTNSSDFGIACVVLDWNSQTDPKLIGNISLVGLGIDGASIIEDIDVKSTTQLNSRIDTSVVFVAFTSSIYQMTFNLTMPFDVSSCGESTIGSDFTINNMFCLPSQHTNQYGNINTTVPYFLNTPIASLRNRSIPLSSSIQSQESKFITIPKRKPSGSFSSQ
ncbi:MAG: hypothetical protein Q8P81_03450 [Nanoarchaeota archaeon]|nr:hypothetical protein [Nanoarchaeota archaeon]